jgi:hypothetical protein
VGRDGLAGNQAGGETPTHQWQVIRVQCDDEAGMAVMGGSKGIADSSGIDEAGGSETEVEFHFGFLWVIGACPRGVLLRTYRKE